MPRVFVRLPGREMTAEVLATLRTDSAASQLYAPRAENLLIADLSEEQLESAQRRGARIYADVQFEHFGDPLEWRGESARYWEPGAQTVAAPDASGGLPDVLDQIRAPDAWQHSRGKGVTIAVVDTGVCATLNEMPPIKRSRVDLSSTHKGSHWVDPKGHGSMCATIAAGTSAMGGRFDGVAPDAQVISARSTLRATDLYLIFDELITLKRSGTIQGPLVISNSYGLYRCSPRTDLPEDHPYLAVVLEAIDEGIPVVFAAGNNHWDVKCNHDPAACSPTSIWGVNSHERVISVGTVNRSETNCDPTTPHPNSSRGPGQWSGALPKPDCVAPTYGEVVWGCQYTTMDWWGTSGACPQVAGLAALLLSHRPDLSPADVASVIRSSCRGLPLASECVGHGIIDCAEALNKV